MTPRTTRRLRALTSAAVLGLAGSALAATITVVNQDGPGEGFNDPTPVAPVGGNPGTTLGAQRLNAFQVAADTWAQVLVSTVPISVVATMDPLTCSSTAATLGQASPTTEVRDFGGAPFARTWYPEALANKLAGVDLDPAHEDITAQFNSGLGTTCPTPLDWYYGFDANPPPNTIDFVSVVTHELGHGLGFETFVDETTGARLLGFDDAFERHLEDGGVHWPAMTDAQRAASAVDTGNLRWDGPAVVGASGILGSGRDGSGRVLMYAPGTVEPGSSVSHFDTSLSPNQLLEPTYTDAIHDPGLARAVLTDIGWGSEIASVTTTTLTTTSTTTTTLTCPATPTAGCRSAAPGTSSLRLAVHATPASARLRWIWHGDSPSVSDFRDPRTAMPMLHLCLYDASSTAAPLMDAGIPAGRLCGRRPCWRALGPTASPSGYRFRDGTAASDGITRVDLHAGPSGSASIVVQGKGASLPIPPLGLTSPVTVQLLIADGTGTTCWQTTFAGALRDDGVQFKAKGP